MKKSLTLIETVIYEIKDALLDDDKIRQLLYYDTSDALDREVPTKNSLLVDTEGKDLNYITFIPVLEKGIDIFERNTYILVNLSEVDLDTKDDGNNYYTLNVTGITTKETYMLDNSKIRLLQLGNRIIEILDNKKFSVSSKLETIQLQQIIFDNETYGYVVKILCSNGDAIVNF